MTNRKAPSRSVVFIIQSGLHVPFYERFPSRLFSRVFVSCFHLFIFVSSLLSLPMCIICICPHTIQHICSWRSEICTERRLRGA